MADGGSLSDLAGVFAAGGVLAAELPGYAPRAGQIDMAGAVRDALQRGENLAVEAGTGTGKTLAYLVPALLAGRRVIISTGTRTLQDQLYHRDLPAAGNALGRPVTTALLKGRSNYLCWHRYELTRGGAEGRDAGGAGAGLAAAAQALQPWTARTRRGDLAEVEDLAEDSPLLPAITSTAENCLGSSCPRYEDCFVAAARREAMQSELVVVNHHLLLADLTIKEDGFGALLPGCDAVIVDEAHHFPDVAQGFFGASVTAGQLRDLARDARTESVAAGQYTSDGGRLIDAVGERVADARLALPRDPGSFAWDDAGDRFAAACDALGHALEDLADWIAKRAEATPGLGRCDERAGTLVTRLFAVLDGRPGEALRWVRAGQRGFSVNLTPIDVAGELGGRLSSEPCTWIFTSATLAVGDDFSHFSQRLGVEDLATLRIPSPFDYAASTLLFLPPGMPPPADPDHTARAVAAMLPLVRASHGRAFLLFTSHRALRAAAARVRAEPGFDYPLLVQGETSRSRLLAQFAAAGNAVLLGTSTFWEGVDIRGDALVLVAIDKLPFASPADPLLAARLESIRERGGNPFRDYQLPQAVLALKQGVGRLVRDHGDYGVVMICDPRLTGKSYGRRFLDSLPPMPRTDDPQQAEDFFARHEAAP